MRTIDGIVHQILEIGPLVFLRIIAAFQHQIHILIVRFLIAFCLVHHLFQQCQRLRHLRLQPRECDVDIVGIHIHGIVAGHLVEFLLNLGQCVLRGTHVAQVIGSNVVTVVVLLTELIAEHQRKEVVFYVLLVDQRQMTLCLSHRQVFLEVHEHRLNGFHLRLLNVLHETAHHIAVSRNGRDGRLVNLLLQRVCTLRLEYSGIAVGEETVSEAHNLLLGDLRDAIHLVDVLLPCLAVNKGLHMLSDAPLVAFQSTLVVQLLVVDDRWQQVVRELSFLQLLDFTQHQ